MTRYPHRLLPCRSLADDRRGLSHEFRSQRQQPGLHVQSPGITFERQSVSATEVPGHLAGFRTLFTAFHHLAVLLIWEAGFERSSGSLLPTPYLIGLPR